MATYTAAQFERLPKWAQQEIERLRLNAERAQSDYLAAVGAGNASSPVSLVRYDEPNVGLARDETVAFELPSGLVSVTLTRGLDGNGEAVRVSTSGGILVAMPQVSNVMQVKVAE